MEGDADLVARIRSGDRSSFDELYDTYADDVFSMCLLILGDPTVARAAAGTAFALVARTRLNPLTDPSRLRSWLLELARGSALAWSGSPQARSVPVPHGVSAEEMIDGAVVPAPASLRVGLARTFDRAAIAAADRQPAHLGLRKVSSPETDLHGAPTQRLGAARPTRHWEPTLVPVADSQPRERRPRGDDTVGPFPHPAPSRVPTAAPAEWRTRPAVTVAAALVLAVAGVTAAVSWPTSSNTTISADTFPEIAVVSPSEAAEQPDTPEAKVAQEVPAPAPSLVPTVAGMFTSVPADERPTGTVDGVPSTTEPVAPAPTTAPPTTDMPPVSETPISPTTDPVPTQTTGVPTEPTPTDGSAPPTDPTQEPTDVPTSEPTQEPTNEPPTDNPTDNPTDGSTGGSSQPPTGGGLSLPVISDALAI